MLSHTLHRMHFGQRVPGCMTQYTGNNVATESEGTTQFRKKKEELEVGAT